MKISLTDCVVVATAYFLHRRLRENKRNSKQLPGPPGYPIVGNMFDTMTSELWETARKWGDRYGGIINLKIFGQSYVIINSYEIAVDILDKQSLNTSDRPNSVMVDELQGWSWMLANMSYGEEWKRLRAPVQKFFEPSNMVQFEHVLKNEVQKLLRSLLRSPEDYENHIGAAMASFIMMVTYGREVKSSDDPFVLRAREGIEILSIANRRGAYLVDLIPWLKYIPSWFPGAGFQTVAKHGAQISRDIRYVPYNDVKQRFLSGTVVQSFVSQLLEGSMESASTLSEQDEETISAAGGVCYIAGADTTFSAIESLLLAMVLFPDVQARAHEELDRVVGNDRLPELTDRDQLPYCSALCKEILRWNTVTPLGLPHATHKDDMYAGCFVQAGTIIFANHWAMSRDPVEYKDPEVFNPERFLPKAGQRVPRDPGKFVFGFGRRICPGKASAENTIFLMATQILAVFNISKAVNDDGTLMEPVVKFSSEGISRHPEKFACSIKPRSKEAAGLIAVD
ncbi:cytochrome P450 [Schizopora paradoxa]|uniref:Cytochrome P450 n=1 Tax=Schizopora paradoxa TaxID=27342 RepID=A0A0H2RJW6_9AGAM|nr:cytochrome P450 [Schizopora paradoxa]